MLMANSFCFPQKTNVLEDYFVCLENHLNATFFESKRTTLTFIDFIGTICHRFLKEELIISKDYYLDVSNSSKRKDLCTNNSRILRHNN